MPASRTSLHSDWFVWTNDSHSTYAGFAGNQEMPRFNHYNPEVVEYLAARPATPIVQRRGRRCHVALETDDVIFHEFYGQIRHGLIYGRPNVGRVESVRKNGIIRAQLRISRNCRARCRDKCRRVKVQINSGGQRISGQTDRDRLIKPLVGNFDRQFF